MMKYCALLLSCVLILLPACGGGGGGGSSDSGAPPIGTTYKAAWPADLSAVYTATLTDPASDPEFAPGGNPPNPPYTSPIEYPPCDVRKIDFGIDNDFLYLRFEFNAAVPTTKEYIAPFGFIEEQWVTSQSISVNWDSDNSDATGAGGEGVDGIDIFCAYVAEYDRSTHIYCNYGFPDGDIHNNQGQVVGELGSGGPGYDYVVARFPVSSLGSYFPDATTIEWSGWSEAESSNADGSMKYHHFSLDRMAASQNWLVQY